MLSKRGLVRMSRFLVLLQILLLERSVTFEFVTWLGRHDFSSNYAKFPWLPNSSERPILDDFLIVQRALQTFNWLDLRNNLDLKRLWLFLLNSFSYGSKVQLLGFLLNWGISGCRSNLLLNLHSLRRWCCIYQFLGFIEVVCHNQPTNLLFFFWWFLFDVVFLKNRRVTFM